MRWHTKPITQLVIMFVVMSMVIGAQSTTASFLASNTNNKPVTYENTDLRKVAGGSGCDAGSPNIILGDTERDPTNSDPRVPISTNRHDYEFSGAYFTRATLAEANASNTNGTFKIKSNYSDYLTYPDDGDPVDRTGGTRGTGVTGILGKMFRYRPDRLADAYFVKYVSSTVQGPDTLVKGTNPIIEVPTVVDGTIYAPDTGYEIAPGYGAMVAYADASTITMHIGRHEYFAGTGQLNCHGQRCSGGYWITISNVCVDTKILNAYNSVKARQAQVGPNIVTDTLQLPMLANGAPIAKANGSPVRVVLRDNGPIISAYKPFYWEGATVRPFAPTNTPANTTPTSTPPTGSTATPTPDPLIPTNTPAAGAPTNTPAQGTPTSTPTVTPTLPPNTTATPTPTGGATPTPEGATPTPGSVVNHDDQTHIIQVTISNDCVSAGCNELRSLVTRIDAGNLESDYAYLDWEIQSNFYHTSTTSFTSVVASGSKGFYFTIQNTPDILPPINQVDTLYLEVGDSLNPGNPHIYYGLK